MQPTRGLLAAVILLAAPVAGYLGVSRWLESRRPSADIALKPADDGPVTILRSAGAPNPPPAALTPRPPLFGMNVSGVVDWSREWAFVDVFKSSRPWLELGTKPIEYDRRGYPRLKPEQSVETIMVREIDGHYPAGKYVCTWKGAGQVDLSKFDVTQVLSQKPGRIELNVKPADGGLLLAIRRTDANDPVRDIRVTMPGFEEAALPFHPLFVERLHGFPVIRFMAWQNTNGSPIKSWSERARVDDARYTTPAGVPIEVMIDLANTLNAAPWFSIPHLADDEYVREFARLVRDRLKPEHKVYVEYSNEVWNFAFGQTRHAFDTGKRLGLGSPEMFRYCAQRSVEIFRIWEEEFGGRDRLVRVLASQAVNLWGSEQLLTFNDAYKHADVLAIAPYFGHEFGDPATADAVAKLSVEALLDKIAIEIDGKNRELIQAQARLARKYGLDLIAYEGGPHMVGALGAENNRGLTELFIAANRHPRMYELQRRHLQHWFDAGGGLYAVFAYVAGPSKWGAWGLLEYQNQPLADAPKMRAIVDLMQTVKPPS